MARLLAIFDLPTKYSSIRGPDTMFRLLAYPLVMLLLTASAVHAASMSFDVAKTAECGCCKGWVEHIRAAGHEVKTSDMEMESLTQHKLKLGIKPQHASCHTATVDGYVIEGHVPVADIERLLKERPEAIGLAAPGMPAGSPGMEMGTYREAHDVVLVKLDGTSEVWTSYPEKQ
jgi:hypothetical protein